MTTQQMAAILVDLKSNEWWIRQSERLPKRSCAQIVRDRIHAEKGNVVHGNFRPEQKST